MELTVKIVVNPSSYESSTDLLVRVETENDRPNPEPLDDAFVKKVKQSLFKITEDELIQKEESQYSFSDTR